MANLAMYCRNGDYEPEAKTPLDTALQIEVDETVLFEKSLKKLQAMIRTLKDEQFVSFIQ